MSSDDPVGTPISSAYVRKGGIPLVSAGHRFVQAILLVYSIPMCRGPTEDIIHYFTLISSELHYLDIIPKIDKFTLMSSTL